MLTLRLLYLTCILMSEVFILESMGRTLFAPLPLQPPTLNQIVLHVLQCTKVKLVKAQFT